MSIIIQMYLKSSSIGCVWKLPSKIDQSLKYWGTQRGFSWPPKGLSETNFFWTVLGYNWRISGVPRKKTCENPFSQHFYGGHLGFFGKKLKILSLWGNDTDVHAICLEICFWGQGIHFLTSDLRFDQFYAKWGSKRAFLGSKMDKNTFCK